MGDQEQEPTPQEQPIRSHSAWSLNYQPSVVLKTFTERLDDIPTYISMKDKFLDVYSKAKEGTV